MDLSKDYLRLGVLLSGSGTTLENIFTHIDQGKLEAKVEVVISSRKKAFGLERARRRGIPAECVSRKKFLKEGKLDEERFTKAIMDILGRFEIDLVVLAGFMSKLGPQIFEKYTVMNIHPALIPLFCGVGYYGLKVHEAVLNSGVKVTGCTVHFADAEYDHGPIILQAAVEVRDDDTPETLAARVIEKERELYPQAIQLYKEGRLKIEGKRVKILASKDRSL